MNKVISSLVVLLFLVCPVWGDNGQPVDIPELSRAVLMIKSHGCSGTVIYTREGYSLILSCAHAFEGADRDKPIHCFGPIQPAARQGRGTARLIKVDYSKDLTLIEVDNGPFYFIPVAPAGYRPRQSLVSMGFDGMRSPITQRTATYLSTSPSHPRFPHEIIWTREQPWEGRSGGALFDPADKVLIGVTEAYETNSPRRGLYVGLTSIREFLWPTSSPAQKPYGAPGVQEYYGSRPPAPSPQPPRPPVFFPGPGCPT